MSAARLPRRHLLARAGTVREATATTLVGAVAAVVVLLGCPGAAAQEINTATRAQLEQLNGIGVTMAERIVVERERAPFTGWEDLERRVKGMRGARVQRLQAQGATVNGQREPRDDTRERRTR
jgi:competence protein ComEA